jgi:dTDP-4-dehydrorhamnose reductase
MRCLVLGGTGRIGSTLLAACSQRGLPHLGTYHRRYEPDLDPLDLLDTDSLQSLIADYQPEVIFYTAPAGMPDALESVIAAAKANGSKLVYFSGDSVLGECRVAKREYDPLKPIGELAVWQVSEERLLRERLPESHLIVRTSRVYGGACRSEPARFIRKTLAKGQTWAADTVRFTMPTYAPDLAEVTLDLLEHGHAGTFHVVGPEKHTDFSFARMIAHVYDLDADLIEPLTEEGDSRAVTVNLDRFKVRSLFGANALRTVGAALRAMRSEQGRLQPLRIAA